MPKTGSASLPLHGGTAPQWLFTRMVQLAAGIIEVFTYEFGTQLLLTRLSDPFWFQALSCVLGFDWHSSGTTTVTCGALKQAIKPEQHGIAIAGGKGKASKKTLAEIEHTASYYNLSTKTIEELQYTSRMTAKIDNSAVQDGHHLYHHALIFSKDKHWAVIQQGLNNESHYARRYHWNSQQIRTFTNEPHDAILGKTDQQSLDMTAQDSQRAQQIAVDLVNDHPRHLKRDWADLTRSPKQRTLSDWSQQKIAPRNPASLSMPRTINWTTMKRLYDFQPTNYEELLTIRGVGPRTVRALALISDLIYGEPPSWRDPVKYSFTVGGKDGVPYPVDRKAMDETTDLIHQGIQQAKLGCTEKIRALHRLRTILPDVTT